MRGPWTLCTRADQGLAWGLQRNPTAHFAGR